MEIKIILVLSLFVAVAFAGVGKLTIQQENDVIALYRSICVNQRETGFNGGTSVYCKSPIDAPQEIRGYHEIRADGAGTKSSQIVFVRPQSNIYKHQLTLTGTSEHSRDTNIYVLPQKDQHEIGVKDERLTITKGDKPHLYYLSKDPLLNDGNQQTPGAIPVLSTISKDRQSFVRISRSPPRTSIKDSSGRLVKAFIVNAEPPKQDTVLVT